MHFAKNRPEFRPTENVRESDTTHSEYWERYAALNVPPSQRMCYRVIFRL